MSVLPPTRNEGLIHPWRWVPTLYFAQGLPYVAAMTLAVVMYKNLQISNTEIALYTSWLYLPWVIKPLWSPVVDMFGTKRGWIVGLQLLLGAGFAAIALTVPASGFFRLTLALFWLTAFSSATHDIAADGFYLLALPSHEQAAFVGLRSTFYRLAMIAGQGGLVYLAGWLQERTGQVRTGWTAVFGLLAAVFLAAGLYHQWMLPRPAADRPVGSEQRFAAKFLATFATFFRKPGIGVILSFLLLYRFAEAQLLKLVTPFLLDHRSIGGLGMTTRQVGLVYGTVGVSALTAGGLAGGFILSRFGLRRMLWPMLAAMYLPNLMFLLLAIFQPTQVALIGTALAIEQFGYGFGFTAYLLYMIMVCEGEHRTAHYAMCTGVMALGMMLPGMAAGWLEDHLGYVKFFAWILAASIPSVVATALIKVDPAFGKDR
jgi:PAT family beta-lactamase induction signal transducer AmpG